MCVSEQVSVRPDRRTYIGGSDARIIMGNDPERLIALWRQKRGEACEDDLSDNLPVQLGLATEALNRAWFERRSGHRVGDVQLFLRHVSRDWMGATLDGRVMSDGSVFEAKFALPWNFSEAAAAEKHYPQLQHNMLVTGARTAHLSIVTGGGQWHHVEVEADALYQTVLVQVEAAFWKAVRTGERPRLFDAAGLGTPKAPTRMVDMTGSNAWSVAAAAFLETFAEARRHDAAKSDLKALVPADAREAHGHGVRIRRTRTGALLTDRAI